MTFLIPLFFLLKKSSTGGTKIKTDKKPYPGLIMVGTDDGELPAWLRLLLMDALTGTPPLVVVDTARTVLRVLQGKWLPSPVHSAAVRTIHPLAAALWDLMTPSDLGLMRLFWDKSKGWSLYVALGCT